MKRRTTKRHGKRDWVDYADLAIKALAVAIGAGTLALGVWHKFFSCGAFLLL
jgi:hypothetical protein